MPFDFHALTDHLEKRCSRRLALRGLAYCDAWPLFQATRVPLFNEYLTWPTPQDEAQAEARVEAIRSASRRGQMTALSAVVRETGEWVSLYRFQPSAHGSKSLEVGVWTHPKFWHGRYSPELMKLCVDSAFECSDAAEIIGGSAVENRGSLAMMRVVGMKELGDSFRKTESGVMPVVEYRLTRGEWLESKKAVRARAPASAERLPELETA